MNRRFVTIEGVVKSVGDRSLWFRETDAAHDICIPLSQIEDAVRVEKGDTQINATSWILNKLEEEGKR